MFSRTTRILLLVAALAGALYWLLGRTGKDDGESGVLASFDTARVDHLELRRTDDTLRFVLEDSTWKMSHPLSDVAEPSTVIALLNSLDHAEIARDLGAPEDLSQFGLAPPELEIIAVAAGDTVLDVDVGKRTVDDAWCYARSRDRNLLLVPTGIARAASLPRDAYRSQRVVDFQLRDISKYGMVTRLHAMTWWRNDRGWAGAARSPVAVSDVSSLADSVQGDSLAVEAVLRRLRGLRVASFIDRISNSNRLSPGEALGVIYLYQARRTSNAVVFSAFRDAEGNIVGGSRSAVLIHDDLSDIFQLTLTDLRDRRLVQFSPPDAQRIEVNLPGASGTIVRSGGAWSFPNPAMGRIDAERAADFVRALRALKWGEVPREKNVEIRTSRFSVTVTGPGDTIIDEMKVDPRDRLWLVTSRSSRGVWLIDKENIDALAKLFAQVKPQ